MAVRDYGTSFTGVWARGIHAVGDQVYYTSGGTKKRYFCRTARAQANAGTPAADSTGWREILPGAHTAISTPAELHELSWADLKDTLENWDQEWADGWDSFADISDTTPATDAQFLRARALLLVYGIWLARNQNGEDRSRELSLHPQLVGASHEVDHLLTRIGYSPLNPANS